jgi:predicted phosphate transport protein (TIGR00153 family)
VAARAEREELRRQIDDAVLVLFALVSEQLGWATSALLDQDVVRAQEVIADDDGIDERCEALIALVKDGLAAAAGDPGDLEHLIAVLQIVPELERSADLVEHIAQRAARGLGGVISPEARGVIQQMCDVAIRMWQASSAAYRQRSRDASFQLSDADDELDDLATRLVGAGVAQGSDPQVAADLALVARFYERIGDHAVNLARRVETLAAPRRLESRRPVPSLHGAVVPAPRAKRGRVPRFLRRIGQFKLVPTDNGFFDLFDAAASNARDCAEQLRKLLDSSTDLDENFEEIKRCEHRGDEITRDLLTRLDASFVTPYDREDIHALAEELDDVVDDMFATASLIHLVGIDGHPAQLAELAETLVAMTDEVVALVKCLRGEPGARHRLERIEHLERQADVIFRNGMARLFNGTNEALEVIKWKDIIEALEKSCNMIEDIADVVESILVKDA